MSEPNTLIGQPISRVDGPLKVTGKAKYAADHRSTREPHLYAVLLKSRVARARISGFDLNGGDKVPGFVRFLSFQDGPLIERVEPPIDGSFAPGELLTPFIDNEVYFVGQHIGVVIAESLEVAEAVAAGIETTYDLQPAITDFSDPAAKSDLPELFNTGEELQVQRGHVDSAIAGADFLFQARYTTPAEHHNPIEPSATLAVWNKDQLSLYDATQGSVIDKFYAANGLGVEPDKVRVFNPFIGGGFGCKGFTWPHTLIAGAAARATDRPVLLVLSRSDMYTSCGHRPKTIQDIDLAANASGELVAVRHATLSHRSMVGDHMEPCGLTTAMLYKAEHLDVTHRNRRLNLPSGTPLRGPGEAPGTFALESAMDELAEKVGIDPIEIRRRNHVDYDPRNGRPWSSKHLLECYERGAEKIGWTNRSSTPRSCIEGTDYVGYGMATACYPGYRLPVQTRLSLTPDGRLIVESAVQDIGTGLYTIMSQMVGERFGVGVDKVDVRIGDTDLPPGPLAGGSTTTASIAAGIDDASNALTDRLKEIARSAGASELASTNGPLTINSRGALAGGGYAIGLKSLFDHAGVQKISVMGGSDIALGVAGGSEADKSFYSFGAIFAEVRVDRDFGIVKIPKMVGVFDAGRIINAKTARSQFIGGMIFGIGMALLEETEFDAASGRIMNANLGEYYVPVNADIHDIDVEWLNYPDFDFNPLGARGIGELGNVGASAAIANAVYNATGIRVRDLPIRLDKLIQAVG